MNARYDHDTTTPSDSSPDHGPRRSYRFLLEYGILVILSTATVLVYTATIRPLQPKVNWDAPIDHHKYLWMADHPLMLRTAPFCYRLIVPGIVSCLPVRPQIGFLFVSVLALIGSLVGVYASAKAIGLSSAYAAATTATLAACGPMMRDGVNGFPRVDAAACCLVSCGIVLALRRCDRTLAVLLAVGAVLKESCFALLPLYYGLLAKRVFDGSAFKRTLKAAFGFVVVFILVRILIPAGNEESEYLARMPANLTQVQLGETHYSLLWILQHVTIPKLHDLMTPRFWYDVSFTSYGPVLFVVLVGALIDSDVRRWCIRSSCFFGCVYGQLFLAVGSMRLLAIGAPMLALLVGLSLRSIEHRLGARRSVLVVIPGIQVIWQLCAPNREEVVLSFTQTVMAGGTMVFLLAISILWGRCRDMIESCG